MSALLLAVEMKFGEVLHQPIYYLTPILAEHLLGLQGQVSNLLIEVLPLAEVSVSVLGISVPQCKYLLFGLHVLGVVFTAVIESFFLEGFLVLAQHNISALLLYLHQF